MKAVAQMTRNERRRYRQKLREQKIMGLVLLACCVMVCILCSTGTTMADRDGTAVLLIAPLGLYLLFTKDIVIY